MEKNVNGQLVVVRGRLLRILTIHVQVFLSSNLDAYFLLNEKLVPHDLILV